MRDLTAHKVDRLLHDAEHADSGARMAGMMCDYPAKKKYEAKRRRLIAEAHALDPQHRCDAWEEASDGMSGIAAHLPVPAAPAEEGDEMTRDKAKRILVNPDAVRERGSSPRPRRPHFDFGR